MRQLLILSFLSSFVNLWQPIQPHRAKWKAIEVGDYVLDFPPDFNLTPMKGIDSSVGKIDNDSLHFKYDFGYYSPSFGQTPQEYLKQGFWKTEAAYGFMKPKKRYNESNLPKINVLSVRPATKEDSVLGSGCDYVARCEHMHKPFNYAIFLPAEIKTYIIKEDSTREFYRKIVLAKNPGTGATGLYIREIIQSNEAMNSYLALSVFVSNLTKSQQDLAVRIFSTARRNTNK